MKVFRLILFILHLGIFILLLGVLMNSIVPPKVFPWLNLLSLGFPILISAYILLTFFWIISWKKRAFVFLLFGLLFFKPVIRWVNFSSKKDQEANLKIVSLNAKGGKFGADQIQDYIDRQNADVVFLQEPSIPDINLKNLSGKSNMPVLSFYSRYEVVNHKNLFEGLENKDITAQCEVIDINIRGKIYRCINVHLESFGIVKDMVKLNGNKDEDEIKTKNVLRKLLGNFKNHQDQIDLIKKEIENSPYPVFVVGDFNSVPNSYEYYKASDNLTDAFVEVGRGSGTSFHDFKFPLRIDYIFTSKSIQPVSYKVDHHVQISDHFPVIATFKLAD
ncbi:endonuclease/exonuclease/phosphatase family protein [Chryseobacterium sp. Y16C]|uniref:endonuclease/exonuclease/phosphatase family protein n=1 Tax=Chryseobacterium sp. Y16C TaxID=2920939 RepID=UPI001F0A0A20|nr:endonuclease/exonuclease/phosphatase family protein [Chryseobacterium sp. Y16C]UMQ40707.1 endonuclease/exonuclease/phosphatase family protein [Chryseobacterium sp. Y16C]